MSLTTLRRFLSIVPKQNLFMSYTKTEEWIYDHRDYTKMGLTKKAIEELQEVVYIDFSCEKGDVVDEGEDMVNIESIKAVESIKAPYDCVILKLNEDINDNIEKLNSSPECVDDSWVIKIDKIP